MATRTFNLASVEKYTLTTDKEEPKTVWILGPIDAPLMAALEDDLMLYKKEQVFKDGETGIVLRLNQRYVEFARFGIKGWENLITRDDKPVPYQSQEYVIDRIGVRSGVKDSLLRSLSLEDIAELAQKIQDLNKVSGDQRKN